MEERYANSVDMSRVKLSSWTLVSVPDPKPTPAWITFSITHRKLKVIYVPDGVWG